jgi:D-alanine-D-alanine ligase
MQKVAVLNGGTSSEREVSLRSGEAVYQALLKLGYPAVKIDARENLVEKLLQEKPEVVFIALHGKLGEDGTLQGLLDIMGIPYTGPGVLASAIGMNKLTTKKILSFEGISTPAFVAVRQEEIYSKPWPAILEKINQQLSLPLVVKATTQGSTIGVFFVRQPEELQPAILQALTFDPEILIEQLIQGTELTAAIIGDNPPEVLPLIEITSETGVYDYHSKYTPGLSHHLIPPRLPETVQARAKAECLRAYQAVGCRNYSRVDCIVDKKGQPFILEVNTAPGMTGTSLFPDAAAAAGLEFPELVRRLIESARTGY